ncbi:hypothetical protein EAF00_005083 [Botryotinia globosa]|nr:hypothetical protein EAF00_005083 [Botryotinia globosa]
MPNTPPAARTKPAVALDIGPGCILWLPVLKGTTVFTCEQHSRLCQPKCELNKGAYNHPILVTDTESHGKGLKVTFITMTSTPMSDDGYSHYSPIGHTFANNFMSEARSRYWLKGGQNMDKLTYLRLFHTYTQIITQDQPHFHVFGQQINSKTGDHCLDEASMTRLRDRLSKPPALPWHCTPTAETNGVAKRPRASSEATHDRN